MDSDANWDIPNPTSMNVQRQLDRLFEQLPQGSPFTVVLRTELSLNPLLPTLSRFMLRPSLTMPITWAFRPLLLDFCARWLDFDEEMWEKFAALGLLIEIHEEIFPVLSAFLCRFEGGPLRALLTGKEVEDIDRAPVHRVLLAYYRILRATPTFPRSLNWDLSCLWRLCIAPGLDRGARWLAIRCYSLQSCMSESVRIRMEQDALGEIHDEDCPIIFGEHISGTVEEVDGWLLPVLEARRIRDYREKIADSPNYFDESGYDASSTVIKGADLCPRIANVHGILLLRPPFEPTSPSSFVLTLPALHTLRQLAVNISLRRPTLLTSSPSSGKMSLINHLSTMLNPSTPNHVITIHLADTSLDPRSLLGSYVSSTSSVGSFEWKDGVLVKAMREGRWVVLKDIDRASSELLGLILPLAESLDDIRPIGSNATLSLGNRGTVEAAQGFALFSTRSVETSSASEFPPLSFLGAQKWREIRVPESSVDDLHLIIDSKFPNIAGAVSDQIIDIWLAVRRLRVVSSTRTIGIRDLEKFCSRVSQLLGSSHTASPHQRRPDGVRLSFTELFPHPSIREEIFLDARDVFFAASATSKPALEQREAIATAIGESLGLPEETREWLLKRRSASFDIEKDVDGRPIAIRASRTVLAIRPVDHPTNAVSSRPFSLHRQALRLVSQIAACVANIEPVLLTGETGTGKTSIVSYLAHLLNKRLVSLNLSNQTESSDLIGGFRPVSARVPALELQDRFLEIFHKTFSSKKNEKLLQNLRRCIVNGKWKTVAKLWSETARTALDKLREKGEVGDVPRTAETTGPIDSSKPRKRRKLQDDRSRSSVAEWTAFRDDVHQFEVQSVLDKNKFSFQFVEGPLVKAVRGGAWVLLDEINLASPETLESVASLLQSPSASITLTERGSLEPVSRHPEFRLFACMNPATDVGKRDLPSNIRARFTEIEVPSPDDDREALVSVIAHYIGHLAVTDKAVISDIAELYSSLKHLALSGKIADGSNHRPHYSMRSLSRALTFAADTVQSFGLRRALWEGFTMAFTMVLDQSSLDTVLELARRTLLSTANSKTHFLAIGPPPPRTGSVDSCVQVGPFWLSSGPHMREEASDYILTPSVQKKLMDLARIVATKRYPVLIEGPTSSGKTSAIQYLARRTGHNFVRINNHEHTDIQEYLGSYVSDDKTGKLMFRDGLLVRALRRGDWIVLDELNLAPTDVLEALNRLLDDNRELVIPETQEVVRPHPNFVLFATQNPSGVYAGRKVLSRALRNRFLEVHFEDVPSTELEHILSQRSRIAPSYAQRIVAVFQELQKRRQIGRIFEGKEGFATLRDLFRWAGRGPQSYQELAECGYMLLAERTRRAEDKLVVKEVIEKVMNVTISEQTLYDLDKLGNSVCSQSSIVWTDSMRRLFILLSQALKCNEPVLLVGETGSGKTSACQLYAEMRSKVLRTVNCHQNTEAADIIGGLRPARQDASSEKGLVHEACSVLGLASDVELVNKAELSQLISCRLGDQLDPRDRDVLIRAQRALSSGRGLLTWQDGPLVTSMRFGDVFLLDEISLADDSVLERLNSVLEQDRTIVLAEKGGESADEFQIVAHSGFKFVATMNPGGDFGKKELSPALRNRFTEIWVPSVMDHDELVEIVKHSWKHGKLTHLTEPMLEFMEWIIAEVKDSSIVTLRDVLNWVAFCNTQSESTSLPTAILFVQGGEMTVLDGLYSLTQLSSWSPDALRALHVQARCRLADLSPNQSEQMEPPGLSVSTGDGVFRIGYFSVPLGSQSPQMKAFSFSAPTSLQNAFRLLRACQIPKPILLEGSPGVGKTSLVTALAAAAGQELCRINLSEQTDLADLFGSDLPVEGNISGSFAWSDAEFLRALKVGNWVLLDEMNLASQSVLEGLNAVFDHRGSVYIPELNRSFPRHPNFRVFAAQNPLSQGSGRKGLPKSFLNRFTKVYVEHLSPADLLLICKHLFPTIETPVLQQLISFNFRLQEEVVIRRRFGILGSPWEFNLRDLIRWASLMLRPDGSHVEPWRYVNAVYANRFRTEEDRSALLDLFADMFDDADITTKIRPALIHSPELIVLGNSQLRRGLTSNVSAVPRLLSTQLDGAESALSSLSQNWLVIVTGPHSSGKTNFARALASVSGRAVRELSLGSSTDTSDLVGSFEQISFVDQIQHLLDDLLRIIDTFAAQARLQRVAVEGLSLLLKLKDGAVTCQQTNNLSTLKELIHLVMETPLFNTLDLEIKESLAAVMDFPAGVDPKASFRWIDGPLIRAMRRGEWLLLDNANLCSPSVLDRLNSLCEANGSIVLTERGVDQELIFPHPNFRLIMTVDTYRGEISRAMRNRGIEIALSPLQLQGSKSAVLDATRSSLLRACPRPIFDLSRRALHYARAAPVGTYEIASIVREDLRDVLSTQLMEAEALYKHLDSSYDTAITLLVLGSASPANSRGLIRLFRSFNEARATAILDRLLLSFRNSSRLRSVLTDMVRPHEIAAEQFQTLHPFMSSSLPLWLSDKDEKSCMVVGLVLEAFVLAAGIEIELRSQSDLHRLCSSDSMPVSEERDRIFRLMQTVSEGVQKLVPNWQIDMREFLPDAEAVLELIYYSQHLYRAAKQIITDFSTVHVVLGYVHQYAEAVSHLFEGLQELALKLYDAYALSSGQRVEEIWSSLYQPSLPSLALRVLDQLKVLPLDTQKRAVDMIAVLCARQDVEVDISSGTLLIETSLCKDSGESSSREVPMMPPPGRSELSRLTSEMNELACLGPFLDESNLKEHMRHLRQSASLPQHAARLISYQVLLWKVDAGLKVLPELVGAHLEWHKSLWNYSEGTQTPGFSIVYGPIFLEASVAARSVVGLPTFRLRGSYVTGLINVLHTCSKHIGGLEETDCHAALLDEHIAYTLSECSQLRSRESLTIAFLLRNIELVICATFPDVALRFPQEVVHSSDHRLSSTRLSELLQRLDLEPFRSFLPTLRLVGQSSSWTETLHATGLCWIALSQILLSLYVPNIPIDPLAVQNCRKSLSDSRDLWLQAQICVYSFWERRRTGHRRNFITNLLQSRVHDLQSRSDAKSVAVGIVRETNTSLSQAFWAETHAFLSDIMSPERLERFKLAAAVESEGVLAQETLFQGAITNFLQRMTKNYAQLGDLMVPIELAVVQLRIGLSTLRYASSAGSSASIPCHMHEAVGFPSVRASHAVLQITSEELVQPGFSLDKVLLLQLAAILRSGTWALGSGQNLPVIQNIYGRIMKKYDVDFADKASKVRQAESLYRSKQTTCRAVDEEPDDEQIRQLFPVFSEDEAERASDTSFANHTSPDAPFMPAGFSSKLLGIHFLLFASDGECPRTVHAKHWRSLLREMVSCWLDGPLSYPPCAVDDDSFAFRLDLLLGAKARFERVDEVNAYSFYRDANVPETRKAANVVKELREKLHALIHEWPDQLVLHHLRDRCDNVLSMDTQSPVAKVLGAIERLLLHTEDWEIFANRENSLVAHRRALTELIVSWRKLELTGWKMILDHEAHSVCDELGDWWFRLYDATVRGPAMAYQEGNIDGLDKYLDSLTILIEEFVTSSPLGQFFYRLKLIRSFASLASRFASTKDLSRGVMKRVACILGTIHRFYVQSAEKVSSLLIEGRTSIEKEVQSLVKLATWRDVNVHALQQSAQNTHRQLYKRIRKFRELLRRSIVDEIYYDDKHGDVSSNVKGIPNPTFTTALGEFCLDDGSPKAKKFASILSNGLRRILNPSSTEATEELSGAILFIQKEYAAARPASNISRDEQRKWNSALLVRKRRSWNDFLKELKRIGLSQNVKPEVSRGHRNTRTVMEQPPVHLFDGALFSSSLGKIDHYFYKCIGLLRDLLKCDVGHHSDVATRELQRGVSSFESAFSFVASARARISDSVHKWSSIQAMFMRLREMEGTQSKCISSSAVAGVVLDVEAKTAEAIDALEELLDVASNISAFSKEASMIHVDALNGVRDWISRASEILGQVSELSRLIDVIGFLSEDNCRLIQVAVRHLEGIETLLTDVANHEPNLFRLCNAIRSWYNRRKVEERTLYDASNNNLSGSPPSIDANAFIGLFLVIGQDLVKVDGTMNVHRDDDSGHVHCQHLEFLQVSRILRMDSIVLHLRQLSEGLAGLPPEEASRSICRFLPFLGSYITFSEQYISEYSSWVTSLSKLAYISGCLVRNIAKEGFCRPPELDDADEEQHGAMEPVDGTGLGQGEGKENVSNEIEDESQFEGIKGQVGEDDHQEMGGNDGAIDVDFDLGGTLEDGPEQDALAEEEDAEIDDEFDHDVSDDLQQIDEHFWDNKEGFEDGETGDSTTGDGNAEMVAKERENLAIDQKEEVDSDEGDGAADERGATEVSGAEIEGKTEQASEDGVDSQMDADTDLVQMEDAYKEAGPPEVQDESLTDAEEFNIDEEHADVEQGSQLGDQPETDSGAGAGIDQDETDEQAEGGPVSQADIHAGNDEGGANFGTDVAPVSSVEGFSEIPLSTGHDAKEAMSAGPSGQVADQMDTLSAPEANTTSAQNGTALDHSRKSTSANAPLPNPHRSLGDALREVKRRFDEILDATTAESLPTEIGSSKAEQSTLEYVPEESTDVDMQALGPALGEETVKLNRLSLSEKYEESPAESLLEIQQVPQNDSLEKLGMPRSERPDNHGQLQRQQKSELNGEVEQETLRQVKDVDNDSQDAGLLSSLPSGKEESYASQNVEAELNKWLHEGQPQGDVHRIWHLYDTLTQTLSFALCEQLRLILEPTRATRLMGDFRTGKRLNMKKIIPYIASNYTKDKIWLRRVRPSQREYQVLIALDDSRSMAESHSIHLAFQTLSLVSKALNRLEVGDVAIASFGERMQVVHNFEDGLFSDQAGTKVLETFKFAQTSTDVRALLESSVEVLTKARERRISSSSSDLWQLEIIISDGICQDHEEIRAIMRKAEEERILIVFIVIDAHRDAHSADDASRSQNSIINMTQAMYRAVNGRLELHMQRYLDSFPFEFFVILENVETLPEVLADTLRQFFERITAS